MKICFTVIFNTSVALSMPLLYSVTGALATYHVDYLGHKCTLGAKKCNTSSEYPVVCNGSPYSSCLKITAMQNLPQKHHIVNVKFSVPKKFPHRLFPELP